MTKRVDEQLLIGLAILQVNWDAKGRSHLDNFVPFAVEALRTSGSSEFTYAEVRQAILDTSGLNLPVQVVGAVLKRAELARFGTRASHGTFRLNSEKASRVSLEAQRQRLLREQRNLEESLAQHASSAFGAAWSLEVANAALLAYVDGNAAALLGTALRGDNAPRGEVDSEERVIVASWIEGISHSDPDRFEYLLNIVKGSMLATGLLLPHSSEMDRPFKATTLILDTPVLLGALGHEGEETRASIEEILALARRQGAKLACLQGTLVEVRSVLTAASMSIGRAHSPSTKPVDLHFARTGQSRAQVLAKAERLDADLNRIQIEVRANPHFAEFDTVDEAVLEQLLERAVHHGPERREALLHDLNALTSVHRLRRNRDGDRLENCGAVFISPNTGVVAIANAFEGFKTHRWPIAMSLDSLATMLWVKTPLAAPDLPRYRLLANCYSALEPEPELWAQFLREIDRLRSDDSITDDDVTFLRYSQEVRRELAQGAVAKRSGASHDLVIDVLARVQGKLSEPAEGQRVAAEQKLREVEAVHEALAVRAQSTETDLEKITRELAEERQRRERRDKHSESVLTDVAGQAERVGKWAGWGITVLIGASYFWATRHTSWLAHLITSLAVTVALLVGNLQAPGKAVERFIADWFKRVRIALLKLPTEEALDTRL